MSDDLARLAADFQHAGFKAGAVAYEVVEHGAVNVKKGWRERWSGLDHAPRIPAAIGYDMRIYFGSGIEASIGPDKNAPQGALGNLLEYGSVNNAPIPGGAPALEAEGPGFERALADAAERLL